MKYYLKDYINRSSRNVKILNVLFTWFDKLETSIYKKIINDNLKFEILLTKRKRKKNDISYLTLRERDENRVHQLVVVLNKTLFDIFRFLIKVASVDIDRIKNFQIKEYEFMPALTMYIFDDEKLIFGPYIADNCDDIPLIELDKGIETILKNPTRDISSAYDELMKHYNILSGREMRGNKEYIPNFAFFDGKINQSIDIFIQNNLNNLNHLLTPETIHEYYDYLAGVNNKFNDDYLKVLGEDQFEGRFDALMRHIHNEVTNNSG